MSADRNSMTARRTRLSESRHAIQVAVADMVEKHDLSFGEIMYILTDTAHSWAGALLRDERDEADKL